MANAIIKKVSPKQKLLARLQKKGGIAANRKALKDLQDFFSKELTGINIQKAKENAWK
jgi:hypothetical protein